MSRFRRTCLSPWARNLVHDKRAVERVNAVNLRKPLILTVVASALVGSLVMNGVSASAASDPGISSTEIVLGMQLPQTGAASPGYNKIDDAARAYFDYVNSKGGVNGRSIKLVAKDDTYKAGVTITTARELINNDLFNGIYRGWISLEASLGKIRAKLFRMGCIDEEKVSPTGKIFAHIHIGQDELDNFIHINGFALCNDKDILLETQST